MKRITESQAWAWLARKWDKPQVSINNHWRVTIRSHCYGLCVCIDNIWVYERLIFKPTLDAMKSRLPKRRGYGFYGAYCWSNSRSGARSRAAFCRKQAKLTRS